MSSRRSKNNNLRFERFKDAPWFENDMECIVGGCGGIGSWLCFLLSRAGFQLTVYDFDNIEKHNIGGQLFNRNQVGSNKVDAIYETIVNFSDAYISYDNNPYNEDSMTNPFIFSAFDNMKARRIMFEKWKSTYCDVINNPGTFNADAIFIDGRLNAETFQIFSVRNNEEDLKNYEANLFDDSEVENESCTFKQTSHFAAMIASYMVNIFTNHVSNVINSNSIRKVPFYYEYVGMICFTNKNLPTNE